MAKRRVSVDDLFQLKIVDEPSIDATGERVAFTVTRLDRKDDAYHSEIWIWDGRTGDLRRLTSGNFRDSQPRWSPDGSSIAFVSKRNADEDAKPQIHCIPVSGGEPEHLTTHGLGIDSFEWSPDGKRMVFVAGNRAGQDSDTDVRVITSARFRSDGTGYFDDAFKQLYVHDIEGGQSRQLTVGKYDHVQPAWSPTGTEIAFVSNLREGWEFSPVRDVYLVKVESGATRQLTDGLGNWSQPSWAPDGSRLVAYGTTNLESGNPRNEVFQISLTGQCPNSLTGEKDIDFRDASISDWNGYSLVPPVWLGQDRLLTVACVRGTVRPAVLTISSGSVDFLTDHGRFGRPQPLYDGSFAAVYSDFCYPGELVRILEDGTVEPITAFNEGWLNAVELGKPEKLDVASPDGELVESWLLRPPGLADDAVAPLLLEIHGGPFEMYADTFTHEFHLLAAHGYAVLFSNPRGSAGYGDRFADLLLPEMGINDFPDLMAAVDAAIEMGWIDPERIGVLGGSYGGFLTNWAVAHSDRFKAAVTQRTVSDWFASWGTDDIFYADNNVTFGATPWEDPELYFQISPLTYVDQMQAPMLIIHSEQDYRCPIGQSEALFTALKRLGRTTEFVRFPDESHGLSRTGAPNHRVERLEHILRWFSLHL